MTTEPRATNFSPDSEHAEQQQLAAASSEQGGPERLAELVRAAATGLGFVRVGFTRAVPFDDARDALSRWLEHGYDAGLAYMRTGEDRAEPRVLLPGARTIIAVALPYGGRPVALRRGRDEDALTGRIAAYAVGDDYHRVLKDKLFALSRACSDIAGRRVESRVCVDTAPLLEREAARRAGVGFTGKSTMTIAPGVGTYLLLGELLVDLDIAPSEPIRPACGRCTACLDACPTGAIVGPYVVDAKRCISYLTIENKGPIPRELRSLVGKRVFGCDECQDVCPFNASDSERPAAPELAPRPQRSGVGLVDLLQLGAAAYRRLVKQSAMRRIGREQLKRNAAVALGNSCDPRAIGPLVRALETDPSALVRLHAAWALGCLGGSTARHALELSCASDLDQAVRDEAREALERVSSVGARSDSS
ncbi:MAG TPA: tRNA epoxyqueuosine(34) reductase QueG [Polyangiaceae bacterium]|nr:tRNA epoxyqueuosine(34) reductase QueG [Polyangiaceae bacterium]